MEGKKEKRERNIRKNSNRVARQRDNEAKVIKMSADEYYAFSVGYKKNVFRRMHTIIIACVLSKILNNRKEKLHIEWQKVNGDNNNKKGNELLQSA